MTDIDEEMVAAAQRRLAAHGRRASARAADASRLPFPDDSFDVVLSWIMLHHVGAWEQALGEALRVTRPGGRLIGYDLLSTRTLRGLHHSQAGSFRALTTRAMRDVIAELPVTQAILTPGLAGATIRFTLTKRGVDPAAA
jgi:ubiquinone/menaquinone biosynthesis C-methylase UbiE